MPIVSDVSELSAFIFMLTEKNDLTLWLQGETYYQISFLCARVSSYLSKDRNREGIGNLDILRCLDAYVGKAPMLASQSQPPNLNGAVASR